MDRTEVERILKLVDVMAAWAEGKRIQVRLVTFKLRDNWEDYHGQCPDFINPNWDWRVKPEPEKPCYNPTMVRMIHLTEYDCQGRPIVAPEIFPSNPCVPGTLRWYRTLTDTRLQQWRECCTGSGRAEGWFDVGCVQELSLDKECHPG